jgi:hypothetical protein
MAVLSSNAITVLAKEAQKIIDLSALVDHNADLLRGVRNYSADSLYSTLVAEGAIGATPGLEERHLTVRARKQAREATVQDLIPVLREIVAPYESLLYELYLAVSCFHDPEKPVQYGEEDGMPKPTTATGSKTGLLSGKSTGPRLCVKHSLKQKSLTSQYERIELTIYDELVTNKTTARSLWRRIRNAQAPKPSERTPTILWSYRSYSSMEGVVPESRQGYSYFGTAQVLAFALTDFNEERGNFYRAAVAITPRAISDIYANAR